MMITVKFINKCLNLIGAGQGIKQIEKKYATGFVHKLIKYIRLADGTLPKKISGAEFLIALGKLKAEERTYQDRQRKFKKFQTKLSRYF